MKILDTYTNEIQHKWEAKEYLEFYEFCFKIMDSAYKEVEYWEKPNEPENYYDHAIDIIQQIESHIITTYLILFKYPAHDALRFYNPITIHEFFDYLHDECINDELQKGIRNILKGKIQQNMDHLTDYERLIIIFCKSIVHYGLFFHHKNSRGFDWEYQEKALRYNRLFYLKVVRNIQANHSQYSDEIKGNGTINTKIVFRGETERKKAILYFTALNTVILERGIFNDEDMFEKFINCLQIGKLDKNSFYEFNNFYIKKLLVNLFEIAKDLFKNNIRFGQLYFIKNTGQFEYSGKAVAGNNWQIEDLDANPVEFNLYNTAKIEFNRIKGLFPSEIEKLYHSAKIPT